jgi:ATP-dependent Clp protease ATP-binding subunit ClpB
MPMNFEKFTERSRGFLQAAQTIAMRESHQRVLPEHLLKALMDDEQGLASNLIRKAGGEPARVGEAVEALVAKQPKVSGGDGQTYIDPSLVRVLDEAEAVAKKAGDAFVRRYDGSPEEIRARPDRSRRLGQDRPDHRS